MTPRLNELLQHLSDTLDARRQAASDNRFRRALDWQPVDHPPLVLTFPWAREAPFQPLGTHPVPHGSCPASPRQGLCHRLPSGRGVAGTPALNGKTAVRRSFLS